MTGLPIVENFITLQASSARLVAGVAEATAASTNEDNLRHGIEGRLEQECRTLGIPWTPYQFERVLRNEAGQIGFADVVHGAVIIEYEPPRSFGGRSGANLAHAKDQAQEYGRRMAREEGRPIEEYVLIAWDGAHIAFGNFDGVVPQWERLEPFTAGAASRLLRLLREQGRPLVHPAILRTLAGPDSEIGAMLIPRLYDAVRASGSPRLVHQRQTKTTLLYKEWCRLFGQAVGIETDRLESYLAQQSLAHGVRYHADVPAYLFSLHTYIAVVAKLVAAMALPNPAQDISDPTSPLRQRMGALESGQLFLDAGIRNMLSGDFFSWYVDDTSWDDLADPLEQLVIQLRGISFDITHKRPDSVRDLFKGIYEVFVPRELRHALGEVYTPDWLAEHAFDQLGWNSDEDLLDPTCGTGTFLLEAIKRRLLDAEVRGEVQTIHDALSGIYGIDLNPLAVLAAKASIVVVFASRLTPHNPVTLPIYLADAINSATPTEDGFFIHTLQTELGDKRFEVPEKIVRSPHLYPLFYRLRELINANQDLAAIMAALHPVLAPFGLSMDALARFESTVGAQRSPHF